MILSVKDEAVAQHLLIRKQVIGSSGSNAVAMAICQWGDLLPCSDSLFSGSSQSNDAGKGGC